MGREPHRLTATEHFDATPLLQHAGHVARARRKAEHLKRPQLSQRIGLAESCIGAFEAGTDPVELISLLHWCQVIKTPMALLFPADPTDDLVRLLQRIACLPPTDRATLTWFLDSFQVIPSPPAS